MSSFTISKKLYMCLGVLIAMTLALGGLAVKNVNSLGDGIDALGHHYARMLYLTGDIDTHASNMLSLTRGIMARGYAKEYDRVHAYQASYADDVARVRKDTEELIQGTRSKDLRTRAQTNILNKLNLVEQENDRMTALVLEDNMAGAAANERGGLLALSEAVSKDADDIAQSELAVVTNYSNEASSSVPQARLINLMMVVLCLLVGAVVVYVVREIDRTLVESIAELRDGADQITSAASQVASSSQSLAQGASEQAASLEQTSASSDEINSMARKNTGNSRSMVQLLTESQGKVNRANEHLEEMVTSMSEISESSGKISKIIKVIDEIAFQTNILALNAAVEAARAGEAGMGFAVVADEVRNLAQRSAQAAKDTATLIEDSINKSREGRSKVDLVAVAIREVTIENNKVKVLVDEVSLGSEEQSRGMDQIGKAITHMEQVTQTTAANAEQGAAAAQELNGQSETLKEIVARLHSMVDGRGTATSGFTHMASVAPRAISVAGPTLRPRKSILTVVHQNPGQLSDHGSPQTPKRSVSEMFPLEENFQSF